jgi:hypothetical protein
MVEAHDDPNIESVEVLIRRIDKDHHLSWDHDLQSWRISTKAFSSSTSPPYGMSVDVLGLIQKANIDPLKFVTSPKYTGSVKLSVGSVRSVGLRVGYDPLEATAALPANPYHAEVWGSPKPDKFSKSQQQALVDACDWFVAIPGVAIVRSTE